MLPYCACNNNYFQCTSVQSSLVPQPIMVMSHSTAGCTTLPTAVIFSLVFVQESLRMMLVCQLRHISELLKAILRTQPTLSTELTTQQQVQDAYRYNSIVQVLYLHTVCDREGACLHPCLDICASALYENPVENMLNGRKIIADDERK